MALNLKTPGVYIEEKSAFPNSVVAVATAVPAFIGYTEKTHRNGQSLINKPVRISSLTEFERTFGKGFNNTFSIVEDNGKDAYDALIGGKKYHVQIDNASRFILYDSMRLFFANGGGSCYIISVGAYYSQDAGAKPAAANPKDKDKKAAPAAGKPKANTISKSALSGGIKPLIAETEPTLLVIPEAVMLEEADCYALQQEMLSHCGYKMKNRFAILDVYNGTEDRSYDEKDVITRFREGVGNNFLSYGAAYYPWLCTSIVQSEEINYKSISNIDVLESVLLKEAEENNADAKRADEAKAEIKKLKTDTSVSQLDQTLKAISPSFKAISDKIRMLLNILPPAAGMAGIYTAVDNTQGVWQSPANVGYSSVVSPAVKITNDGQEDMNVTASGKSVNAIRSFVGEGTVVWGARTLDGNSQDWRYINVRRTLLFIEESVKNAAKAYVYAPNNAGTWALVNGMISNFLNGVWTQGGLAGVTPGQAYEVSVGLGSTMTPNDILDGVMRIMVKVAVTRPAEFIVITFQQKMQES